MSADAAVPRRGRNRERTEGELRCAMLRLKNTGQKISIKAVAEAAGVDPSLVHNTYPRIADEIRALQGRSVRQQRNRQDEQLKELRRLLKDASGERDELRRQVADIASHNLALVNEVTELKAELQGKIAARIGPGRVRG